VDKNHLTQFGWAMQQLGIELIPAYSPEARGRSERMFRTHQGHLPKELALTGITTMAEANVYLESSYRPAFKADFAHPARERVHRYLEGELAVFHCYRCLRRYDANGMIKLNIEKAAA